MMQDFATNVEAILLSMGWKEVATDVEKMAVRAIFSAPGATEQELLLKAGGYKRVLAEFGGPENYPKVEEYDVELEMAAMTELAAVPSTVSQVAVKEAWAECARELEIEQADLRSLLIAEANRIHLFASVVDPDDVDAMDNEEIADRIAFCYKDVIPSIDTKEETVIEKAHLERNEAGSFQPDGDEPVNDVPAGNPANRGLLELTMHDAEPMMPHDLELAADARRDLEDAVSLLGQPLVSLPEAGGEEPMDRNELVLMSMKNLNKMASRLRIKGHSKLNKVNLIDAIAFVLGLPSTLPIQPKSEREEVKEQMAVAHAEMLDRPAPPVEDGLPDLENFVEVGVLAGVPKIRVGHTAYLVSVDDDRRISIKGVRFELKRVVAEKELRFSNKTIVPAKWLGWVVRAIFAS